MGKYIRIFIAIVLVLGIVLLARDQVAWAKPAAEADQSAQVAQGQPSLSLADDYPGTGQQPDDEIEVCKRGNFSVGGTATLEVKKLKDRDCLRARTRLPDPALDQLPSGAGTILSDVLVLELPASGAKVKICFAVPPGKQVKIYSSGQGSWRSLKTTVRNGIACVEVTKSGSYTLVGQ